MTHLASECFNAEYLLVTEEESEYIAGTEHVTGNIHVFRKDTPTGLQTPKHSLGVVGYEAYMFDSPGGRIAAIVLIQEAQSRGLGTKLVNLVEARMLALGVKTLTATLPVDEALEFWEKMGYVISEDKMVAVKNLSSIPSNPEPTGTCYSDAWRFLVKEGEGFLVHGSVQLSAEGSRINHAWVELTTGWIWEPQTGQYSLVEDFRIMSPIEEHRYTSEQAAIMIARTGNMGPWNDEERLKYMRG